MIDTKEREAVRAPDRMPAEPDAASVVPEVATGSPVMLAGAGVTSATNLLRLQQTAGNAAVAQLLRTAAQRQTQALEHKADDPWAPTDEHKVGESSGPELEHKADDPWAPTDEHKVGESSPTDEHKVGESSGPELEHKIGGADIEHEDGDADVAHEVGAEGASGGEIGSAVAAASEDASNLGKGAGAGGGSAAGGAGGRGGGGAAAGAGAGSAGGAGGGGSAGGAETAPAMPEISQLGVDDLANEPTVEAGHQVDEPAPEGEGVDTAAGGIAGAQSAAEAPVSGILDTILDTARSALRGLAGRAGSVVRSAATTVRTTVRGIVDGAKSLATTATSAVGNLAKSAAGAVVAGIRTLADGIKQGARAAVTGVLSRLQGIVSSLAGPVRAAISAILGGGGSLLPAIAGAIGRGLGAAFTALPAQIQRYTAELIGLVASGSDRIFALIELASDWITDKVQLVSDALLRAVTWVQGQVTSLLATAAGWVATLPSIVRTAVQWLVDRVIALAQRVVSAIGRAAEAWIRQATEAFETILQRLRTIIETALRRITTWIIGRIVAIQQKILRVLSAVQRFRSWLVGAIQTRVQRVIAAISARINQAIVDLVVRMIGPQLRAAVEQTRLAFPNGMPAPAEIADAAANAGNQISSRDERGILEGLLRPEGDHIGISIAASGSLGEALGVGGAVGCSLDAVFDYRRNEVGFFVTPQVSAQVNIGEVGAEGFLNMGRSWGTVGSFGDPNSDVLNSWGGWSTGVTYGAQVSVAEGFGGGIQTGGTIYRGGSYNLGPGKGFSYTPLGAGTRTEPGQPIPTQDQPGTPGTQDAFHMGEVRFPTGVGDVSQAQPAAGPVLDAAATAARGYPQSHTGAQVTRVTVTGEASPPWRHPRPGLSPDQENQSLSQQRADGVAAALGGRLPDTPLATSALGSRGATGAGLDRNDPAPERQRALITGEARIPGTPATTTGGGTTPPQTVPNTFNVDPSIPNPFTSDKAAWGWDTNIGIGAGGGEAAQAGVYGGITTGFAFPIGKAQFSALTMKLIRIAVGLYKLVNDVLSGSPLAFIRDAVALGVWGVEELVGESITNAVLDWAIPMPAGAGGG